MDTNAVVFEIINFLDNDKTSMHNVIGIQIKVQIYDSNGRFKKSNMKIVSSFNALFPALLLHEKKKDIRFFWPGVFAIIYLFSCVYLVFLYRYIRIEIHE